MFINTLSFLNSDSVEVTIMDADKTSSEHNMVLRQSGCDYNLNIKVIFNQAWVDACGEGKDEEEKVRDAKQKAKEVLETAEQFYNGTMCTNGNNCDNGLGKTIQFTRVGGKLVYCHENIFKLSKFNKLYRKFK